MSTTNIIGFPRPYISFPVDYHQPHGTMTCFTSDYDLVHRGLPLTNFTDEHDPLTGMHDSLCKLQEITIRLTGLEREHNPYNNLLREDDHNISHRMNSWPHRWSTTHFTGRLSSSPQGDYDTTPKRMVTTHLIGDTTQHILGNDLSHTCESRPVSNGM